MVSSRKLSKKESRVSLFPLRATWFVHLILLDVTTLTSSDEGYTDYKDSRYVIFSVRIKAILKLRNKVGTRCITKKESALRTNYSVVSYNTITCDSTCCLLWLYYFK